VNESLFSASVLLDKHCVYEASRLFDANQDLTYRPMLCFVAVDDEAALFSSPMVELGNCLTKNVDSFGIFSKNRSSIALLSCAALRFCAPLVGGIFES